MPRRSCANSLNIGTYEMMEQMPNFLNIGTLPGPATGTEGQPSEIDK